MAAPASAAASAAERLDARIEEAREQIRLIHCLVASSLHDHPNLVQNIEQKTLDSLTAITEKVDKIRDRICPDGKRKTPSYVKREESDEKISEDDEPLEKRRRVLRELPQATAASVVVNHNRVSRAPVRGRRPAAAAAAASDTESSDSDDDLVDSDCDDVEQMLSVGEPCETCTKLVTADGGHGADRGDRCGHCISAALCGSQACRDKHWASPECQKATRKSMTERRRMHILDKDPDALLFKPECVVCRRAHGPDARSRVIFRVCLICNWSRVCGSLDCSESHRTSCACKHPERARLVQARLRAAKVAAAAAAAVSSVTTAMSAL